MPSDGRHFLRARAGGVPVTYSDEESKESHACANRRYPSLEKLLPIWLEEGHTARAFFAGMFYLTCGKQAFHCDCVGQRVRRKSLADQS